MAADAAEYLLLLTQQIENDKLVSRFPAADKSLFAKFISDPWQRLRRETPGERGEPSRERGEPSGGSCGGESKIAFFLVC